MTLPGQPTGNPTLLESFETGRRGPCLSQSSALHKDSHPRRLPHRAKGLAWGGAAAIIGWIAEL